MFQKYLLRGHVPPVLKGHVQVHGKHEAAEVVNAERARLILNVGVVPGDVFEIQFSKKVVESLARKVPRIGCNRFALFY